MSITMFDAVDTAQLPSGAQAVAGYVDGNYRTFPAIEAGWPHALHLSIAISAADDADVLDIETGDATPADAAAWYERQKARGISRPCLYANASTMDSGVIPAMKAAGIDRAAVRLWSAHYTGEAHICGPASCGALSIDADGCQWTDRAWGRDLDESLLVADFFGTPKPAAARKKAAPVTTVPIEITDSSIVIHATVNGQPWTAVLDTGDAIGPTFTAEDAQRLGLVQGAPFGVEGAGGASSAFATTATIAFDDVTYPDEPSAIDLDLQGQSLLGLPFFLAKAETLTFNFAGKQLSMTAPGSGPA